VQQVTRAIQIHVTAIAVAAVEDEDVVAHKVKVLKEPIQIHRTIQPKDQKMVLRQIQQMARHIVAVAVAAQREKM
jgi:hypothetical protein